MWLAVCLFLKSELKRLWQKLHFRPQSYERDSSESENQTSEQPCLPKAVSLREYDFPCPVTLIQKLILKSNVWTALFLHMCDTAHKINRRSAEESNSCLGRKRKAMEGAVERQKVIAEWSLKGADFFLVLCYTECKLSTGEIHIISSVYAHNSESISEV